MFRSWKSLFTCMLHVSNNGCVASPFSATLSKSLGTEETHFVCWKVKCFCISCLEKGVQQLRVFPFFFLSFFLFDVLFFFLNGPNVWGGWQVDTTDCSGLTAGSCFVFVLFFTTDPTVKYSWVSAKNST